MKLITLLPLVALPATHAWTFTWRNADGEAHTERGDGPTDCVSINHAGGELFNYQGQGEENINMLLYSTHDCSGEDIGSATEKFVKVASRDIGGFKIVSTVTKTSTVQHEPTTSTVVHTSTGSGAVSETTTDTGISSETEPPHGHGTTLTGTVTQTETATETGTPTSSTTGSEQSSSMTPSETPSPTTTPDAAAVLVPSGRVMQVVLGLVFGRAAWEWML